MKFQWKEARALQGPPQSRALRTFCIGGVEHDITFLIVTPGIAVIASNYHKIRNM
jgi:hypothetical protein